MNISCTAAHIIPASNASTVILFLDHFSVPQKLITGFLASHKI